MRRCLLFLSLFTLVTAKAQQVNIIPKPVEMKITKGEFILDKNTCLLAYLDEQIAVANVFNEFLKSSYGFTLPVKKITGKTEKLIFFSSWHAESNYPNEGYKITVQKNRIEIAAKTRAGWFYGIQTLIQLLPIQSRWTSGPKPKTQNQTLKIPQLSIYDYPRFTYRGMHLDCARHFWPVSFIKQYIDYLALHKMNYFHWHLTDDQGWRIEIKKYPNLTKIGAKRNGTIIGRYPGKGNDETPYDGFYTQEQIKEIVKYAADRYITVVPEIEMPGHCSAAIASYPFLSCFPNEPTKIPAKMISRRSMDEQSKGRIKLVQETWGVFDDVFCAGKDSTFEFLQNVLDEVLALFPSKYIHAGGDECPKSNWKRCPSCQLRMKNEKLKDEHELQSYFIQRIEKYLNSKGRKLIGWDEILEGGLAPNAMVMSWRGESGGIDAARQGHDVVMTPGNPVYFDYSQSQEEDSVTIGGYNPLEKVYAYEPIPKELNAVESKHVLGAQGNVWTEYMKNTNKVEYQIFPRMSALSEVLWSKKEDRNWEDFEKRLMTQFKRYELWGANYSTALFDLKATVAPTDNNIGVKWILSHKINMPAQMRFVEKRRLINQKDTVPVFDPLDPAKIIKYILQDSIERKIKISSGLFDSIIIKNSGLYSCTAYKVNLEGLEAKIDNNFPVKKINQAFYFNKATGKKITLTNPASQSYPGDGAFTLVNGVINEKGFEKSREFLGFLGKDCEAVIDLGEIMPISFVVVNCLNQTPSWIWQPRSAEVFGSSDGEKFYSLKQSDVFTPKENGKGTIQLSFRQTYTRYLKVAVKNWGTIPEGNPGAGTKAWLFVDEIEVE